MNKKKDNPDKDTIHRAIRITVPCTQVEIVSDDPKDTVDKLKKLSESIIDKYRGEENKTNR